MNRQILQSHTEVITTWPITSAQEGHWLLEQIYPGNPAHSLPCIVKLTGTLNITALERSCNEIINRHDVLRAYFPMIQGVASQVIRPFAYMQLPLFDISVLAEQERNDELKRQIGDITHRSFNLSNDCLYRILLVRISSEEHVLALNFHHIIFDGQSKVIFLKELSHFYKHFAFGTSSPSPLPQLPVQYTNYAVNERESISDAFLAKDLSYWEKQLSDETPELNLMYDFPKSSQPSITGTQYSFWLSNDHYQGVKLLCRKEKTTTFLLLLTVLKVLLNRYTGQEDLIVGCPVSGRNLPELESAIGLFVNTLVIRSQLNEDMIARAALQKVRAVFSEAFQHQNVPFSKLVSEFSPTRGASTRPFFQVMLNMHNKPLRYEEVPGLLMEEIDYKHDAAIVDLTLKVNDVQGKLQCALIYNKDVFKAETIARMAGHFQILLEGFIANPDSPIGQLPILTKDEKHEMLYEWNSAQSDCPQEVCIHELFQEQVKTNPNRIALSYNDIAMTYAELDRRANQLANYLRGSGLKSEGFVAICLDRSPDTIVSILGVLKAGGAYVPIDATYPAERIAYILDDSNASLIITDERIAKQLPSNSVQAICLDKESGVIASLSTDTPVNKNRSEDLAYVIYTSGSTGKPKGVAVPHQGIVRLVKNVNYAQMGPEETFLQLASVAFDASAIEIYGSLLNGGRLVILDANQPSLRQIAETIRQQQVTFLCANSDILNLLLEDYSSALTGVRQIITGGDILPISLASKCLAKLPQCQLINCYGPTENSVNTTTYPVKEISHELSIPIGRPIAGDSVYILDQYLQPVPIGVIGELYVSGNGVARGYLNNNELTQQKFLPNPFTDHTGNKLYRTGDLARYRADKNIEFLGRMDHQVKIRGCRIELGEVEAVIAQYPGIAQAVASAWKGEDGAHKLVAYVVMKSNVVLDQHKLRSFIQERLPKFMVPTFVVELQRIPVTSVGKIDRKRLPAPNLSPSAEQTVVSPRNRVEEQLVVIWEKLLEVRPISVLDNFFDLGGHSLLAMQLFSEIEEAFMKKLSVSIIFQENTIEKLANLLSSHLLQEVMSSSLVAIQPLGNKPPLFCIHELNGEVICYRKLALELGEDRPVIGLRYAAEDDASEITIQQIAATYVKELRKIQPEGPFSLLGYSLGGLIAFEMAQQLQRIEQDISLLCILDTRNPKYYPFKIPFIKKVLVNISIIFKIPWSQKVPFMFKRLNNLLVKKELLTNSPGEEAEERARNFLRAFDAYDPSPYPGKIIFFRAIDNPGNLILDDKNGWENTESGSMDMYSVPGNHSTILDQSNVKHVVNYLQAYL